MVYVSFMLLLFLLVTCVGVALHFFADEIARQNPGIRGIEFEILGILATVVGGLLSILFAVGLFWRRGLGGWIYQVVLISLGLTSCYTWIVTIPLLIYWIRQKDDIVNRERPY